MIRSAHDNTSAFINWILVLMLYPLFYLLSLQHAEPYGAFSIWVRIKLVKALHEQIFIFPYCLIKINIF